MKRSKVSMNGMLALVQGHGRLETDSKSNKKMVRVSSKGVPLFAIEISGKNVWLPTADLRAIDKTIRHEHRSQGITKNGVPAKGANPGMHSGLKAFLQTNELTCFHPQSLDEVWTLIEGRA